MQTGKCWPTRLSRGQATALFQCEHLLFIGTPKNQFPCVMHTSKLRQHHYVLRMSSGSATPLFEALWLVQGTASSATWRLLSPHC